jgi:hypothetical protein
MNTDAFHNVDLSEMYASLLSLRKGVHMNQEDSSIGMLSEMFMYFVKCICALIHVNELC